jgi:hypothetical protein
MEWDLTKRYSRAYQTNKKRPGKAENDLKDSRKTE